MISLMPLIVGAVVALVFAWVVNAIIRHLGGDDPGSLRSAWWDIFSGMWSRESSYAQPLPEMLRPPKFRVGDKIQLFRVPLNVDHSISRERQELLQRCVGNVLRVEGIDTFGALELHVLDNGTQAPDRRCHIVFVEPQYAERAQNTDLRRQQ